MHITTATMTTVLDTLERKGYIRRQPDLADRRRVLIDITPDAQALLNRVLPEIQQLATATLSPLGYEALAALLDGLAAANDALAAFPATSLRLPPAGRHRVSIVPLPPGQRAADLGGPDGAARMCPFRPGDRQVSAAGPAGAARAAGAGRARPGVSLDRCGPGRRARMRIAVTACWNPALWAAVKSSLDFS